MTTRHNTIEINMTEQENTQPQLQSNETSSTDSKNSNISWSWRRVIWLLVWLVAMSVLTVLYIQDRTGQSPSWWPWLAQKESNQTERVSTSAGELRPNRVESSPTASLSGLIESEDAQDYDGFQPGSVSPNTQQAILTNQPTPRIIAIAPTPPTFPFLSNSDILVELNAYRAAHKIPALVENQLLCQYAEKRVEDLIAYGGLDNHAGFTKDTENYETLPESLKQYPGGAIGENLAYQYCKNMTTGDSFIASTPQQLIEWCFDSSIRGHREAQLNPKYTAACVRNQQGYVVVIFGE